MTRILIDGRPIRQPVSGVARYCASLANAMQAGKKISSLSILVQGIPGNDALREISPQLNQARLRYLPENRKVQNFVMEFVPTGLNYFLPEKFDLIHETYFARLGERRADCCKISTIHDTIPLDRPEYYSFMNRTFSKRNLFRQAREADHVICVSEYTKSKVIEYTGVSSDKITVIGSGAVDADRRVVDESLWPIKGMVRKEDNYGLFVSNIEPRKNLTNLIRAWPKVLQRDPEMKLVVVGKKNYQAEADLALGAELLGDNFIYLGSVSESEKWTLLAGMALMIFPTYFEGYGLPVIEAYLVDRPVVFSRNTSLVELATDDRQMFDPDSTDEIAGAVLRVMDHPGWLAACCERGKQLANKQNWSAISERTIDVYRRFVDVR